MFLVAYIILITVYLVLIADINGEAQSSSFNDEEIIQNHPRSRSKISLLTAHTYVANMQVSTIIGSGGTGNIDGVGLLAQISNPIQICVDETRNLMYVVSFGDNNIRSVNMATLATSIIGTSYSYSYSPTSCSITNTGDLYVVTNTQLTLIPLFNQQTVIQLAGKSSSCKSK